MVNIMSFAWPSVCYSFCASMSCSESVFS